MQPQVALAATATALLMVGTAAVLQAEQQIEMQCQGWQKGLARKCPCTRECAGNLRDRSPCATGLCRLRVE